MPVLALLAAAASLAACGDAAAAARGSCREQDVGELRCRAIVADAALRVRPDHPPVLGATVRMATAKDRVTLRAQLLVATVRFSYLDGTSEGVEVFCTPRSARTALCVESVP